MSPQPLAKHRHREVKGAPSQALGGVASRALTWSFVNTAASRFGTLAIGIVLARLLGPTAFGTFAVATVALVAVLSFNELGVSLAIVRWQGDPRDIAATVTTISVVTSLLLTLGAYAAAPGFAVAMGDPAATDVVRLMMVCILINGLVATPAALLQREFRQGKRMIIDQVNVWVGAILSISLALTGMGAMSLAIGRVAGAVLSAILFIAYSPLPLRFGFDRTQARHLLKFGLPLAGSSIIVFAVGYADQLTAGAVLGTTALGYYVLAFNLASWPVSMFSQPLRSVAPAAFARLQHDREAMTGALRSIIGLLAAVTLPICLLLAGAATPIVEFVYGEVWAPAAPVLTWLAILAAFRIFFELAYDYLVVLGRSHMIFTIQVAWLVVLVPGLLLGASLWGLPGLAGVQVVIAALVIVPLYLWEFRTSGLKVRAVGRRARLPLVAGVVVGLIATLLADVIASQLLACVVAGFVCAAGIALLLYRDRAELSAVRSLGTA
jgi:O-antigen/teichoic acid export membrane protein